MAKDQLGFRYPDHNPRLTFLTNTFLNTSIPTETPNLLPRDLEPISTILSFNLFPSHGHPYGICDSLSKRPGGDLDTGVFDFWMSSSHGVDFERLGGVVVFELFKSPLRVAGEVEENVLEETGMSGGEYKSCIKTVSFTDWKHWAMFELTVTPKPVRVEGVVSHVIPPEGDTDGGSAHNGARMTSLEL